MAVYLKLFLASYLASGKFSPYIFPANVHINGLPIRTRPRKYYVYVAYTFMVKIHTRFMWVNSIIPAGSII
jgi:hypothetical protein